MRLTTGHRAASEKAELLVDTLSLGSLMRRGRSVAIATFFALGGPSIAEPVEDAKTAFDNKDYVTAFRLWETLAEQGDAKAQENLGSMYENGLGVSEDYSEALDWLHKAADQDNAAAQGKLGWMYESGLGVTSDYAEAANWYR
jgi:uncharacterized protein